MIERRLGRIIGTVLCVGIVLFGVSLLGRALGAAMPCKLQKCRQVWCLGVARPTEGPEYFRWYQLTDDGGSRTECSQAIVQVDTGNPNQGTHAADRNPHVTLHKYRCEGAAACVGGTHRHFEGDARSAGATEVGRERQKLCKGPVGGAE